MVTYTENIIEMRTEPVEGLGQVVRFVTLYVYGSDENNGYSKTIKIKLDDPDINNFIDLETLTLDMVLSWAYSKVSIQDIKEEIMQEVTLDKLGHNDLPWNGEVQA